jgi:hypothetical protein
VRERERERERLLKYSSRTLSTFNKQGLDLREETKKPREKGRYPGEREHIIQYKQYLNLGKVIIMMAIEIFTTGLRFSMTFER